MLSPAKPRYDTNSSPAAAGSLSYVYFGSYEGMFYAANAQTGEKVWEIVTGGAVFSPPEIRDGMVFFGSGDANFYAADAKTGRVLWKYNVGAPPTPIKWRGILSRFQPLKRLLGWWKSETAKPKGYEKDSLAIPGSEGFGAKGYKTGAPGAYKGSDAVGEYTGGRKRRRDFPD